MFMENRNKKKILLSVLITFFIISMGASNGSSHISILDTISVMLNKILNLPLNENIASPQVSIIWKIRLPRVLLAFIVGGIICVIGQIINDLYSKVGNLDKIPASTATSITLIFIGAFLTGLGVYDLIGKRAGAGSIIPITGFANSIVSPAMEYKREGFVLGVGANLFKIAGPVLVYGIGSSIICGFIYYIFTLIK